MAELPLITLPAPESRPQAGESRFVPDSVRPLDTGTRMVRLDDKFGRIPDISSDPELLSELRSNPEAIVPERALVFEVATSKQDLHKALERIPELNFLGEEEGKFDDSEDFFTADKDGNRTEKSVPRRIFFTLPSIAALNQLKKLWEVYKSGERLTKPHTSWKQVFEHLSDVRAWGPQDRLSSHTRDLWKDQILDNPDEPIRMQAELWFREAEGARDKAYGKLEQAVSQLKSGGQIIDRVTIPEIRYDSALLEIPPRSVQDILDSSNVNLVTLDDVMTLRVESMVRTPYDDEDGDDGDDDVESASPDDGTKYQVTPIAALIDGAPISQHTWLKDRLIVDDPDNFLQKYGTVADQKHGTSMASIIIHGDLNSPTPLGRSARRLYVRPVMQPRAGPYSSVEAMPPDRTAIDLTHRAFIRMFDGDEEGNAVAPEVRVVNISLGDATRPFESNMSPWARLIDYLAWKYRVLIIVSAGNRGERMIAEDVDARDDLKNMSPSDREAVVIKSILQHRAARKLLSPSESLNCLTVGAAHSDMLENRHSGLWVVDPYENSKLPNPSSAQGFGYRRSVKPEILMPGGREHIEASQTHSPAVIWPSRSQGLLCGIGSAAPGEVGDLSKLRNYCGTSVATALTTHGALHILAALEDLQLAALNGRQMNDYIDVLLKALLVHSAGWDKRASERIQDVSKDLGVRYWEHRRHDATRLLGFGSADISRAIDCTNERATLIGWNSIEDKNVDTFRIPIPNGLKNLAGFRAVTATVAWSTPLNMRHRAYRAAKLAIHHGSDKELSLGVTNAGQQPSHNVFGAGTVFHRRWEGDEAKPFVDNGDIVLDVSCTSPTQDLDEPIRYGIAVSLEVGEDIDVSVYNEVSALVRQRTATRMQTLP